MTRLALAILALIVMSDAAAAKLPCLTKSQAMDRGDHPRYREVDGKRCWYVGRTPKKSAFVIKSSSGGVGSSKRIVTPGETASKRHTTQTVLAARQPPMDNLRADIAGVASGPLETNAGEAPGPSTHTAEHAPEQARLTYAFNALSVAWNWRAQIQTEAMFGILRLSYAERWPAWEMAARWP